MYKNIEKEKKLHLADLVAYQAGQVVSKTLVQNDAVSMTIFSFDKGEEISSHAAGGWTEKANSLWAGWNISWKKARR